jgi:hypothetical protein
VRSTVIVYERLSLYERLLARAAMFRNWALAALEEIYEDVCLNQFSGILSHSDDVESGRTE